MANHSIIWYNGVFEILLICLIMTAHTHTHTHARARARAKYLSFPFNLRLNRLFIMKITSSLSQGSASRATNLANVAFRNALSQDSEHVAQKRRLV